MDQFQYLVVLCILISALHLAAKHANFIGRKIYLLFLYVLTVVSGTLIVVVPQQWDGLDRTNFLVVVLSCATYLLFMLRSIRAINQNEYENDSSTLPEIKLTSRHQYDGSRLVQSLSSKDRKIKQLSANETLAENKNTQLPSGVQYLLIEEDEDKSILEPNSPFLFSPNSNQLAIGDIEQEAVRHVIQYETSMNREIVDVSDQYVGYDLHSYSHNSTDDYAIEVKGKARNGSVVMTSNEWNTAKEMKQNYRLYIVNGIREDATKLLVVVDPTKVKSKVIKYSYLLKRKTYKDKFTTIDLG